MTAYFVAASQYIYAIFVEVQTIFVDAAVLMNVYYWVTGGLALPARQILYAQALIS